MKRYDPSRALAIAAGLVIIALTAAAFWLSYAHLAEVALAHGLGAAPERAWAWPATLDLFIVAGELLMLRAALTKQVDPWAIGLTVAGSGGSIALNVAGVGTAAGTLDYVVAAVPPTAALLAFGALMRQVHQALASRTAEVTTEPVTESVALPVEVAPAPLAEVAPVMVLPPVQPGPVPVLEPLVICGDRTVFTLTAPLADTSREVADQPAKRLPTEAARVVLESCWSKGTSPAEAARLATRSVTYVKKVFARLDHEQESQPVPGPLALVGAEASA